MSTDAVAAAKDFEISRTFNAPRQRVFDAWTHPDQLSQWMSPKGFQTISANMDLKPGGTYHYGLRGPNNMEMWGKWIFREIDAPAKLVLVNTFSDKDGGITRHPMSATWPLKTLSTMTFDEHDGKTTLNLRWSPIDPTPEERATFDGAHDGMRQGWTGTMDQLDAFLTGAN
jgi:uncharacterized protein YndB with AHSA1/START domain